jgi:lia operon protein LiaG
MKTMKPLGMVAIILAVIAVASLGIASLIAATTGLLDIEHGRGIGIDEKKSFPSSGIKRISVKSTSYDVRVSDSPDAAVNVRLHGTILASNDEAVPYLVTDLASGTLTVSVEQRARFGFRIDRIVMEIGLPSAFGGGLSVVTTSGDIDVADRRYSEAVIKSTSGDISIGRLACGSLSASATSGDIQAVEVEGEKAVFSTSSGNMEISSLSGDLDARSTSGDISVAFAKGPGSSAIQTTSGNVAVWVPSSAGFTLDARATSGDIECALPITMVRPGNGRNVLQGTVGTPGDAVLRIATTSGDARIGGRP